MFETIFNALFSILKSIIFNSAYTRGMQSTDMRPLVSIIVPVYNVKTYLEECINSLLGQTYNNIEIILVDDGSSDGSGAICDKYSIQDNRVKVHHIQNQGVSHARNLGIDKSEGEWLTFVDADDTLDLAAIQISVDYIVQHIESIDILQFGGAKTYDAYEYCTKSEAIASLKLRRNACASLYRASVIKNNNIRFIEGLRLGEDQLFNYSVVHHSRYCQRIANNFYKYRQIDSSSTHTPSAQALIKTVEEINKFSFQDEFSYYLQILILGHVSQFANNNYSELDTLFAKLISKRIFKKPYYQPEYITDRITGFICRFSPYLALKNLRLMLWLHSVLKMGDKIRTVKVYNK